MKALVEGRRKSEEQAFGEEEKTETCLDEDVPVEERREDPF
jgi:hypothetical protein